MADKMAQLGHVERWAMMAKAARAKGDKPAARKWLIHAAELFAVVMMPRTPFALARLKCYATLRREFR